MSPGEINLPSIAILEDNAERVSRMKACIAEMFPELTSIFFDKSAEIIAWLSDHQAEVLVLSLDHDLPLVNLDGRLVDFGTGQEVADFLAGETPTCPIIVHSSNLPCGQRMMQTLQDAGWPCVRVFPRNDDEWIATEWIDTLLRLKFDGQV